MLLPNSSRRCAGVNSFGFGGTNAHVVVAGGKEPLKVVHQPASRADFFVLSAATKSGLTALAQNYQERIAHLSDEETANIANAVAHRRDRLTCRLAISTTRRADVSEALRAFIAGAEHPQLDWSSAVGNDLPIAFVYSGNGGQWPGMGVVAYRRNSRFRAHFNNLDDYFRQFAGWSLKEALLSEQLAERLPLTRVAQPLVFAIQSAMTAALRAGGVRPAVVLGHSVGEVAAAEAAGILDLRTAVEVIYARSTYQELVRGAGRMVALLAGAEVVAELLDQVAGVEIAAFNSPRATTVSGPADSLARLKEFAKRRGTPVLDLDLDYPFHTALMAPVETPLVSDLKHIAPRDGAVPFVSTVTGSCLPGLRLGAGYWWQNVREPVRFTAGIRETAKLGARFFIEIGPRGTLLRHISDSLAEEVDGVVGLSVLERNDPDQDPVKRVVSKALIGGAEVDNNAIFGADPGGPVSLPTYPWQQERFRYTPSPEAIGVVEAERHPFSGARYGGDALQWYAHIDTALFPDLAGHRVGEQVIFPGAGFLEIAFAVAREWLQSERVLIADLEILKPLDLTNGETREVMSRVSPDSHTIEIFSRPRLSQAAWLLHCRSRMLQNDVRPVAPALPGPPGSGHDLVGRDELYRLADACGLHYGSAFRLLDTLDVADDRLIQVTLTGGRGHNEFVFDPIRVDACGHGLITVFEQLRAAERGVSYLPVRLDEAALFKSGGVPQRATIEVVSRDERAIVINNYIFGAGDELIAILRGVRCQAVQLRRSAALEANAFVELLRRVDGTLQGVSGLAVPAEIIVGNARALSAQPSQSLDEEEELIEGWATAAAYEIASGLVAGSTIDVEVLVAEGRLPTALQPWLTNLLSYLEAAGLAKKTDHTWTVICDSLLPRSAAVLKDLAHRHPRRAAEILIAGAVTGLAEEVQARRAIVTAPNLRLTPAVHDFWDLTALPLKDASAIFEQLVENDAIWPKDRAVRVLQVGFGPLAQSLVAMSSRRDISLKVLEPDRRRCELAERALPNGGYLFPPDAGYDTALGEFDLVLAVGSLHRLPAAIGPARLREALVPGGLLLALELKPTLFRDLAFGLDPDWFTAAPVLHAAGRRYRNDDWQQMLRRAGFDDVQSHPLAYATGHASLLVAGHATASSSEVLAPPVQSNPSDAVLILDGAKAASRIGAMLNNQLRRAGLVSSLSRTLDFSDPVPNTLVHIVAACESADDPLKALTARCLAIKTSAERFGSSRAKLWLVFRGALAASVPLAPVATGAWAFSRTLANEYPHLDVRRIDIASHVPEETAVARLCEIVASGTLETELLIDGTGLWAVRAEFDQARPRSCACTRRGSACGSPGTAADAWSPVPVGGKRPDCARSE